MQNLQALHSVEAKVVDGIWGSLPGTCFVAKGVCLTSKVDGLQGIYVCDRSYSRLEYHTVPVLCGRGWLLKIERVCACVRAWYIYYRLLYGG
jgi:hypothetical protein